MEKIILIISMIFGLGIAGLGIFILIQYSRGKLGKLSLLLFAGSLIALFLILEVSSSVESIYRLDAKKTELTAQLKSENKELKPLQARLKPYEKCRKNGLLSCSNKEMSEFFKRNKEVEKKEYEVHQIQSKLDSIKTPKFDRFYQQMSNQLPKYGLILGLIGLFALALWAMFRKTPLPYSDIHGSARFADMKELMENNMVRESFQDLSSGDFYIGSIAKNEKDNYEIVLPINRATRHIMLLGSTGSGKTYSLIAPNILSSRNESMFISDVKRKKNGIYGELWTMTSGYKGNKAIYFSPMEPEKNMLKFNWIPAIQGDVIQAKMYADAIVFSNDKSKDSYWAETARDLLAAIWLYVAETDTPTPTYAYQILMMSVSELNDLLESSPVPEARFLARTYLDSPEKTAGSTLSTARNAFSFMLSREIQDFTNTTQATDFTALRRQEQFIYYQARSEKKSLLKPVNCLILTYVMNQLKESDGLNVKFVLDEFANFGTIPNFQEEITLLRDKGMPIIACLQSMRGQLEENYGRNQTDTILTNFNNKFCFTGLDEKTAEEISRYLGEKTEVKQKASESYKGMMRESTSYSIQETKRRLMTADEIMRMSKYDILAFHVSEIHPFITRRINYDTRENPAMIEEKTISRRKRLKKGEKALGPAPAQIEIEIPPMPDFE